MTTPAAAAPAPRSDAPSNGPDRPRVELVDWRAAATVAGRLAPPGDTAPRAELEALVAELRDAAGRAVGPVREATGMTQAEPGAPISEVVVVDRAGWARANTQVMAAMVDGAFDAVVADGAPAPGPAAELVGAAQVGATLALLSSRVLGQFDPYSATRTGDGPGRLLLVAPNVLAAERRMGVDPADFRLWVSLHEQTHALQFATAPWLADHLAGRARDLLGELARSSHELGEASLRAKLGLLVRAVRAAVQGGADAPGLLAGVVTPEQREHLADVTAVMALLEGHADVAMDAVGPAVVPTVASIRRSFEARRDSRERGDVIVRRLLGMDAKLAQYRDGAAFVRAVEGAVGQAGLNAVWSGPDALPTAREIADPRAWVRRVHG